MSGGHPNAEAAEAYAQLQHDPVFAAVMGAVDAERAATGESPMWHVLGWEAVGISSGRRGGEDLFVDLIDAIASQQLSVKAAATIMGRFLSLFPDKRPDPAAILRGSEDEYRAAGLSRPKIRYILGIADAVLNHGFDLNTLWNLPDEEVIDRLMSLKGVGRWTAEMLMMFSLRRPDVFSIGDLGLRTAVARHYGIDRDDTDAISAIASAWRPYRTLASRYLWASLNNAPLQSRSDDL